MKFTVNRVFGVSLLMALLLIPSPLPAQEQTQGVQASVDKTKTPINTPDIADIVPLAAELTVRLARLERKMKDVVNISHWKNRTRRLKQK
jgi:hypothetical protein